MTTPSYCENGLQRLAPNSSLLHNWAVPITRAGRTTVIHLRLHRGSFGFVLCHFIKWYLETIEPYRLVYSYADRLIRGSRTRWSNHAGYAVDVNPGQHPLGAQGTIRRVWQGGKWVSAYVLIRARLVWMGSVVAAGAFYIRRKDEMHYENRASLARTEKVARRLASTPRGRIILAANPTQRRVIWL